VVKIDGHEFAIILTALTHNTLTRQAISFNRRTVIPGRGMCVVIQCSGFAYDSAITAESAFAMVKIDHWIAAFGDNNVFRTGLVASATS